MVLVDDESVTLAIEVIIVRVHSGVCLMHHERERPSHVDLILGGACVAEDVEHGESIGIGGQLHHRQAIVVARHVGRFRLTRTAA